MSIHCYTSFSFSYLSRARVWAASLRRQHPDWVIWAVVTDKEPDGFTFDLSAEEFDHVLWADQMFGEETDAWLFGHDIVEACTAVKGRALEILLSEPGVEQVYYFDPDIALFGSMGAMVDTLRQDGASIILTPHQTTPDVDGHAIKDNEITSLDYGVFNLGFLAVANTPEARRFARWWSERLHDWCHDRLDIGVFVDQKWCNLVPCFFDEVIIDRDPGYNVASWNLSQRKISITTGGDIEVNGKPLRFFHFTKMGPVGDVMTQKYAGDNVEVYEIWAWYKREVAKFETPSIPNGWWYYGTFDDGTPIPKSAREFYRGRKDLQQAFRQPRQLGDNSLTSWLRHNADVL